MDKAYAGDGSWMNLGLFDPLKSTEAREGEFKQLIGDLLDQPKDFIAVLHNNSSYQDAAKRLARAMYESTMTDKSAEPAMVLDVGCGYAAQSVMFHEMYPDAKYTGINISADQVDVGKKRVAGLSGVEIKQASATNLVEFPVNGFSHVYALECAFHFDRAKFFKEAHRVLKPGGKLAMMDIIGYQLDKSHLIARLGRMAGVLVYYLNLWANRNGRNGIPDTVHDHNTAAQYADGLKAAGFTNVKVVDISDQIYFWEAFPSIPVPLLHPLGPTALRLRSAFPGAGNFLNWRDCGFSGCRYVQVTAEKPILG